MIRRLLVWSAIVSCLLVGLSFLMFARDQVSGASSRQVQALAGPVQPAGAPSSGQIGAASPVAQHEAQPRRFIDSAAHTLTSPFASLIPSASAWVQRGIPTALALLVYGLGLGYAARFTSGLS